MTDQLYFLLHRLLMKHKIRLNQEELKLQLHSHPSYPSLHALTGVLDHFGVPNLALSLVANTETFLQLPQSFIANISYEEKTQLVLVEKKENSVIITLGDRQKSKIHRDEFLKVWSGVVFAIEKDENYQEAKHQSFRIWANWGVLLLTCSVIVIVWNTGYESFAKTHFILGIVGLVLSIVMMKYELGMQSSLTNNICNLSDKTSCDVVLNSKGARLFGIVKLSDISLVTFLSFGGYWIIQMGLGIQKFPLISIITLLSLPLIAYTIYYQFIVLKKWCPLCLGISGILILQMLSLTLVNFSLDISTISILEIGVLFFSILFMAVLWMQIKPLLIKFQELRDLELAHHKFKRNFSLFQTLCLQQKTINNPGNFAGELMFGEPNARIELLVVTSPFCHFCKKMHRELDALLSVFQDRLKLTIRFKVDVSNKTSGYYKISNSLLNIYNSKEAKAALNALHEVYGESVDLEKWYADQDDSEYKTNDAILNRQYNWCNANEIHFTPALFINQRQFPAAYEVRDLGYFIDDFIEQMENFEMEHQALLS